MNANWSLKSNEASILKNVRGCIYRFQSSIESAVWLGLSPQQRQEKRNNFLIILSQSLQFTRIVYGPEYGTICSWQYREPA